MKKVEPKVHGSTEKIAARSQIVKQIKRHYELEKIAYTNRMLSTPQPDTA